MCAYYAADCVRGSICPSELEEEAYWISLPPDGRKRAIIRHAFVQLVCDSLIIIDVNENAR